MSLTKDFIDLHISFTGNNNIEYNDYKQHNDYLKINIVNFVDNKKAKDLIKILLQGLDYNVYPNNETLGGIILSNKACFLAESSIETDQPILISDVECVSNDDWNKLNESIDLPYGHVDKINQMGYQDYTLWIVKEDLTEVIGLDGKYIDIGKQQPYWHGSKSQNEDVLGTPTAPGLKTNALGIYKYRTFNQINEKNEHYIRIPSKYLNKFLVKNNKIDKIV